MWSWWVCEYKPTNLVITSPTSCISITLTTSTRTSLLYLRDWLEMYNIINLTWHPVRVKLGDGKTKEFSQTGNIRLSSTTMVVDTINDIPITTVVFWESVALPPEIKDTIYIVSKIVCEACPHRCDFYIPTGKSRNDDNIIRCSSLSPNPYCHAKWTASVK